MGQFRSKIVLEDGTELPHEPLVMVRPGMGGGCIIRQIFGNGTVIYSAWTFDAITTTDECAVFIRLEGFRSKLTTLHEGAVVSLKRMGEGEGVATPASSVTAPKPAAKAYGKGVEAMRKGRFAEAQESFEKAVQVYPEYAQAYCDLGEALEKQQRIPEAKTAYEKALSLSPRYLKPYAQLARLEISQGRYEAGLDIANRAVKLNAIEFPSVYYYRALALRNLHRLDEAAASAKEAVEMDVDRQLPRALFLLGVILEEKGDRPAAVKAFDLYIKQTPKPADAAEVGERIARLSKPG